MLNIVHLLANNYKKMAKTMKWNWFFEHPMLLVDNIFRSIRNLEFQQVKKMLMKNEDDCQ
jgi:hypothetical protein